MFEVYDKDNKISLDKAKEINNFMVDNYMSRKENMGRPRSDFYSDEKFNMWFNMLQNENDYYTLIYYLDNKAIAFISYAYMFKGLCLCEVQIREEYQNKGLLRKMLSYIINNTDLSRYDNVCGSISNNLHSVDVFTHIGMKHSEKYWYEISLKDLIKWINKK